MVDRIDRIDGLVGSIAVKAPVKVATSANIILSGAQTISGIVLTADESPRQRVLVKNQASSIENGIYDVNSGAWTRSPDFDGSRDAVDGTQVLVNEGATPFAKSYYLSAINPVIIGTTSLTFVASTETTTFSEPDFTEADQGVTGGGNTIKAAVDAIGASNGTILLKHNSGLAKTLYTLTTNETIPSNVTIERESGAYINGAGTFTINGPFKSGLDQAFGDTITVSGTPKIGYAPLEWFGDTSGDSFAALEAAAAAFDISYDILLSDEYTINYEAGSQTITGSISLMGTENAHLIGSGFPDVVDDLGTAGFFLADDNSAIKFKNVKFSKFSTLIRIKGACESIDIQGSEFTDLYGQIVVSPGSRDFPTYNVGYFKFDNNNVHDTFMAIALACGSTDNYVTNNRFNNIFVVKATPFAVIQFGSAYSADGLDDSDALQAASQNIIVTNNAFTDIAGSGLVIISRNLVVADNTFSNLWPGVVGQDASVVYYKAYNVSITGNVMFNCGSGDAVIKHKNAPTAALYDDPVATDASSYNVVISGNIIYIKEDWAHILTKPGAFISYESAYNVNVHDNTFINRDETVGAFMMQGHIFSDTYIKNLKIHDNTYENIMRYITADDQKIMRNIELYHESIYIKDNNALYKDVFLLGVNDTTCDLIDIHDINIICSTASTLNADKVLFRFKRDATNILTSLFDTIKLSNIFFKYDGVSGTDFNVWDGSIDTNDDYGISNLIANNIHAFIPAAWTYSIPTITRFKLDDSYQWNKVYINKKLQNDTFANRVTPENIRIAWTISATSDADGTVGTHVLQLVDFPFVCKKATIFSRVEPDSTGDTGTIALGFNNGAQILAATPEASFGTRAVVTGIIDGAFANMVDVRTDPNTITMTIAGETITSGILYIDLEIMASQY